MDQSPGQELRKQLAADLWRSSVTAEDRIHGLIEAVEEAFPEAAFGRGRERLLETLSKLSAVTLQLALGQYEAATWILHRHVSASVSSCLTEALGGEALPAASRELNAVTDLLGLSHLQQQLASLAVLGIVSHDDTALAEVFSRWEREMPPSGTPSSSDLALASREVAGQSATSLLLSVLRVEFRLARWRDREAEKQESAVGV